VEPLIARFILPWYGGSPEVWTVCMLFFQLLLLGGYAYAHASHRWLPVRRQVLLHFLLLAAALLLLPVTPSEHWIPVAGTSPTWRIFLLLVTCLGLPYFLLSATGPLAQAWSAQVNSAQSPYRLYALSNVGSILALLCFPLLVEPHLSRHAQVIAWSAGFGLFAAILFAYGCRVWQSAGQSSTVSVRETAKKARAAADASGHYRPWLCFGLPACASVLLLAVTNKICQDIAVVPFLWVVPLVLYLLSFVISFDHPRWYWRPLWVPLLILAVGAVAWMMLGESLAPPTESWLSLVAWALQKGRYLPMFPAIGIYLLLLLTCGIVCHGEVYRLRPPVRRLTGYYLLISAGGALGGIFVAVVAPLIFKSYFELHCGIFAALLLIALAILGDRQITLPTRSRVYVWALVMTALLGVGSIFYRDAQATVLGAVELSRNFYGVIKVFESDESDPRLHRMNLRHGGTLHGVQYLASELRSRATTYYTPSSGVGLVMKNFPRQADRRVGLVGLGVGTLAVYGRTGDYFRFYEINEEMRRLAETRFTFLRDSAARIDIVLGDARLSLEREQDQHFDILVLDAFNSDSIPVHLLTREAFEIYCRHLQPDGVIAVHISNRSIDLEPVVQLLARQFGFSVARIDDDPAETSEGGESSEGASSSNWILLSRNKAFMTSPPIVAAQSPLEQIPAGVRMWTDEDSSVWPLLHLQSNR
jgi:hypothetical protein